MADRGARLGSRAGCFHVAPGQSPRGPHRGERSLVRFKADLASRRADAFERARDATDAARFRALVLDAAAWIEIGEWTRVDDGRALRDRPVAAMAAEQLDRRWGKILKRGKRLAELDRPKRHRLRIAIKKLRYATDF